jgi:hypothetical protein
MSSAHPVAIVAILLSLGAAAPASAEAVADFYRGKSIA